MENNLRGTVFEFIMILLIVMGSLFIGYFGNELYHIIEDLDIQIGSRDNNCSNLTLKDTAYCMRNSIVSIYTYNLTEDGTFRNYTELQQFGGDCETWSLYFDSITPEGYLGKVESFFTTLSKRHAIFILSNDEGYCVLDQISEPACNYLKQNI